jgi:hypothetical protein
MLFACGADTGSGVDGDKKLPDLTADEIKKLCAYNAAVFPDRDAACPSGTTKPTGVDEQVCIEVTTRKQTEKPNCAETVSDDEACSVALGKLTDAQICDLTVPEECAPGLTDECL